jgi:hypothetical protein
MRTGGDHPDTLPLFVDRGDGAFVSVDVPVEDYPAIIQFPEFLPPGYFGRPYNSGVDVCGVRTIQVAGPSPEIVGRRLGAKRMQITTTFKGHAFPRLIAKIAYAFVVADVGLPGIDSAYVLPAILGETDDIGRWFGCDGTEYITDPRYLHGVAMQVVNGDAIVRVRLFVNFNTPEYIVAVGRLKPNAKTGNFRPSGHLGEVRTRTLAEVQAGATRAPAPSIPENHAVSVAVQRGS